MDLDELVTDLDISVMELDGLVMELDGSVKMVMQIFGLRSVGVRWFGEGFGWMIVVMKVMDDIVDGGDGCR